MSLIKDNYNGKWRNAADLENAVTNMENNLENMNKTFINKMLKALSSLMVTVQHKEANIFNVALRWFRLYLKVLTTINPNNRKLLKHYENTVPTIITYIIGCLQYKSKEMPNYHYDLLEILEELLENVQAEVLSEITKFEIGTIGCLWNPIDLAGDFNTQSKALKILTILLKQFDGIRQNEELKCIKWTNLNLFQDKLKTIVQETQLTHVIENTTRELLNNYNMNLSKNVMVYSFYCTTVLMDNKYTFYKPLNLQKFWIDINYSPKTLSFKARFKLYPKSKFEDINVILKIQIMKLQNNILLIYYKAPGDFSKHANHLTNVTDNVIQFSLTQEEVKRLKSNNYVMEYFNSLNETSQVKPNKNQEKDQHIFNLLKNDMSTNLQDNKRSSSLESVTNSFSKTKKTKYEKLY
ncbi:uncharacterized protein LOC119607844 [Lucilia sericata]|uniref:uncharacterized protein LOC119607844 n=1 Tax=Lucilia sericata TaxID=13632 RepID=UPI0018A85060|nr:uncharacterized protein LOC119607844 [Lucilia sericata]XP_037817881.1 uncharacterized protein LOC119607844 [Lucilia sericata]